MVCIYTKRSLSGVFPQYFDETHFIETFKYVTTEAFNFAN